MWINDALFWGEYIDFFICKITLFRSIYRYNRPVNFQYYTKKRLPILSTDNLILYGAENETRTRDPNLGKVMLYQLSYFRIFSFAVAKVGIFRKPANILPTFFTEICSLCTYRKTIILIINSFGHDNLHKKIACIFQLSPLLSRWQWQDDEFR